MNQQDYAERYAAKTQDDDVLADRIWEAISALRIGHTSLEYVTSSVSDPFWCVYSPDESIRIKIWEDCVIDIRVPAEHRAQVCRAIAELEG